jgi:hypothetical protein
LRAPFARLPERARLRAGRVAVGLELAADALGAALRWAGLRSGEEALRAARRGLGLWGRLAGRLESTSPELPSSRGVMDRT